MDNNNNKELQDSTLNTEEQAQSPTNSKANFHINIIKITASTVIFFVLVWLVMMYFSTGERAFFGSKEKDVACSLKTKICADGSVVSREGSNCEFTPCISDGDISLNNQQNITKMTGLFWMSGLPGVLKGNRSFENYLNLVDENLKTNIYLDGIYIAIGWNYFETSDGVFDFQKLDQVIEIANKYDKKIKLVLVPGINSPNFIYEKGAKKFITKDSNKYHSTFGDEVVIPIPWDPVYKKYFKRAVEAFAKQYSNEKNVIAVTVTGANFMSPELHLPSTQEDLKNWQKLGDHEVLLEETWKEFISFFAKKFPNQLIGLELAKPMSGMEDEVERLIDYLIDEYPNRSFIQSNQLNGRDDNSQVFTYQLLSKYKDGIVNGFQNVASFTGKKTNARQGSFEQTITNFKNTEAEYYEVWYGDGQDKELSKNIQKSLKKEYIPSQELTLPQRGAESLKDIEYAQVDGQSLRLDIYMPQQQTTPPPLLVWIHGGGWRNGDKSASVNPVFKRLAKEGYATAYINYRLGGLDSHPKQIQDVKGAIRWLRANADTYGYDATRIGVGGGSAGGHLALLAGLSGGVDALEGNVGGNLEYSSRVQAVVDLFGPSELQLYADESTSFSRNKSAELLLSASPLSYLTTDDPPIIIFHGSEDNVVPVSQSIYLNEQYQSKGLESSLYIINGASHGGLEFSDGVRFQLIKDFLDTYILK